MSHRQEKVHRALTPGPMIPGLSDVDKFACRTARAEQPLLARICMVQNGDCTKLIRHLPRLLEGNAGRHLQLQTQVILYRFTLGAALAEVMLDDLWRRIVTIRCSGRDVTQRPLTRDSDCAT